MQLGSAAFDLFDAVGNEARVLAKSRGVAIHHDADVAVVAHGRPMINFREGIVVGHACVCG